MRKWNIFRLGAGFFKGMAVSIRIGNLLVPLSVPATAVVISFIGLAETDDRRPCVAAI
jgi:hypothetical protein